MRIGVISDTHGYFDPKLPELLAGVEVILHAGDVDSQNILDELELIAPVHAVRGNVDGADLNIPPSCTLSFEGVQIQMQHKLPSGQSEVEAWSKETGKTHVKRRDDFLKNYDGRTRVVIFGHSHEPCLITLGHILFFNPGSAGKKRFSLPRCCGLLELSPKGVRATIVGLEGEEKNLPEKVWLPPET
ncbi:MAG: metallophosphoesterase family protein [Terriglobia bacterium]